MVGEIEKSDGHPTLVFCVTKDQAEVLAEEAAKSREPRAACEALVNQLDEVAESNPTIRRLRQTLPKGVAFHNANLDHDERRLVEAAVRTRQIDLLIATPTLSAGVNLPVKTVIFDSCYRRWVDKYISAAEYMNMAGRAGRRGYQESGKSILLAGSGAERERFETYLTGGSEEVKSVLVGDYLDRILLQAIAGGIATTEQDVSTFFRASFHGYTHVKGAAELADQTKLVLRRLTNDGLLAVDGTRIKATVLGHRVARAGVLPRTGAMLFERLSKVSALFDRTKADGLDKQVLLLATACPDISLMETDSALLFVRWNDDLSTLRDQAAEFIGIAGEADLPDVNRCLLTAAVAYRFIQMDTYSQLSKMGSYVSGANVRRAARACAWMFQAAAAMEDARGSRANPEFRRWLNDGPDRGGRTMAEDDIGGGAQSADVCGRAVAGLLCLASVLGRVLTKTSPNIHSRVT